MLSFSSIFAQTWSSNGTSLSSSVAVGIGTTAPAYTLDVQGSIGTTASIYIDNGDLVLKRITTPFGYVVRPNVTGFKKLQFAVAGGGPLEELVGNAATTYFTGNVGVGTSFPVSKLHVQGTRISIINNGEARLHIWNMAPTTEWLLGQKSATSHNYTISTSVSGTETDRLLITPDGKVGIGTDKTGDGNYRLFVETGIRTRKVKVDLAAWPDYVFDKEYELPTIQEVREYIEKNGHLPGVAPATQIESEGLDLGDNQSVLLKKIEELTLYVIQLKAEIDDLKKNIK